MRGHGSVARPVPAVTVRSGHGRGSPGYGMRPFPRFRFPSPPDRLQGFGEDGSAASASDDAAASTGPADIVTAVSPEVTMSADDAPGHEGHRRPLSRFPGLPPIPPPRFRFPSPPSRLRRVVEDESTAPSATTTASDDDATASSSPFDEILEPDPAITVSAEDTSSHEGYRGPLPRLPGLPSMPPPPFRFPPMPPPLQRYANRESASPTPVTPEPTTATANTSPITAAIPAADTIASRQTPEEEALARRRAERRRIFMQKFASSDAAIPT